MNTVTSPPSVLQSTNAILWWNFCSFHYIKLVSEPYHFSLRARVTYRKSVRRSIRLWRSLASWFHSFTTHLETWNSAVRHPFHARQYNSSASFEPTTSTTVIWFAFPWKLNLFSFKFSAQPWCWHYWYYVPAASSTPMHPYSSSRSYPECLFSTCVFSLQFEKLNLLLRKVAIWPSTLHCLRHVDTLAPRNGSPCVLLAFSQRLFAVVYNISVDYIVQPSSKWHPEPDISWKAEVYNALPAYSACCVSFVYLLTARHASDAHHSSFGLGFLHISWHVWCQTCSSNTLGRVLSDGSRFYAPPSSSLYLDLQVEAQKHYEDTLPQTVESGFNITRKWRKQMVSKVYSLPNRDVSPKELPVTLTLGCTNNINICPSVGLRFLVVSAFCGFTYKRDAQTPFCPFIWKPFF